LVQKRDLLMALRVEVVSTVTVMWRICCYLAMYVTVSIQKAIKELYCAHVPNQREFDLV
jgi:hypothetical protein